MGSAKPLGSFNFGAISSNPAVANTDSAKPGSLDCQGSAITTIAMAKPSDGIEWLCER